MTSTQDTPQDPPQTYKGHTFEAWEGEYDFGHESKNRIVLSKKTEEHLANLIKRRKQS